MPTRRLCFLQNGFRGALLGTVLLGASGVPAAFTPLTLLPAPGIVGSATAYPGGRHEAANLLDGDAKTEYSSDGKATNTFVEFEFAAPVRVGAFRHVDRNDPAIIAASELVFLGADGSVVATVPVTHVNKRGGETFLILPSPVTAQRAKWRVTKLGPQNLGTVGGAEIAFFAAGAPETAPRRDMVEAKAIAIVEKRDGGLFQPVRVTVDHPYAEPAEAVVRLGGVPPQPVTLKPGKQTVELSVPAANSDTTARLALEIGGETVAQASLRRQPVRPLTVYILPHSHTDIGYTEIQTDIEKKQVQNLLDGIAAAKRTADYPEGARFVWNVEVGWAADLYLRRLSEAQKAEFLEAVKRGQVGLNGMYLNELTGLCRPEELIQLFRYSTVLGEKCGVTIDSAMISDVPGYTWGTVTAMAQAGIRYFSTAPNYFDRIGDILVQWENKPFWWAGPDGKDKVLVWIPYMGYAMSHLIKQFTPQFVEDYLSVLEKTGYPYEIAYVRWSGHGDNAVPDPAICEFVKEWNATHVWPRFVITTTSTAFREFEKRYGERLPMVRGDWTPYWEDGAGSSALETAMNRNTADRIVQAEALYAMLDPKAYPAAEFEEAWRNTLLYSEHTWGADCSVSDPESKKTREQWEIKKSYADEADRQSRVLLERAMQAWSAAVPSRSNLAHGGTPSVPDASVIGHAAAGEDTRAPIPNAVDLFNTTSWLRSELVLLPAALSSAGDRVLDDRGRSLPSQRLSSGELAFVAEDVPAFAARRYTVANGPAQAAKSSAATVQGAILDNGLLRVRVDETTGAIVELSANGIKGNLADVSRGEALNDYLFLPGEDLKNLKRNGAVRISVKERGPLVASLLIESEAPGCRKLTRELRMVAGTDYVELINTVDKERAEISKKAGDWGFAQKGGKESINFAFPFNVPDGDVSLDIPLGWMRPELEQMPSACKNWFTVGRWADVSNRDHGVTLVTLDAPLLEVGGITANMTGSQTNPNTWRKKVERTQRLYVWAMNNHWHTNYRAYQEGPVVFRFVLRPHRRQDPMEANRFATGFSQPLLPVRSRGPKPGGKPFLRVEPAGVLVTALKPSDDGQAWIIRLFGAGGKNERARLIWAEPSSQRTWLSGTGEKPLQQVGDGIPVAAWDVVTLRVERP